MVLDTCFLKVWIKGKMEQSRGKSTALGVVAIEKGAFRSTLIPVSNFTFPCVQLPDASGDEIVSKLD